MRIQLLAIALLCAILLSGCVRFGAPPSTELPPVTDELGSEIPTEAPTEAVTKPSKPLWEESGVLYSQESETLILFAKWKAVSYDERTAEVTVDVGITCYGLSTGKHEGQVTVNGEEQKFTTRPIANTTVEKKRYDFASFTFEIELDKSGKSLLDLEAVWNFEDSDGTVTVEQFKAAAIIRIPGGEVYLPEGHTAAPKAALIEDALKAAPAQP